MKKINFNEILMNTAGGVVGGVVAGTLVSRLNINTTVKCGLGILAGAIIPVLAPKSNFVKALGLGMSSVSGQKLAANYVPAIAGGIDDNAVAVYLNDNSVTGVGEEVIYPINSEQINEGVEEPAKKNYNGVDLDD